MAAHPDDVGVHRARGGRDRPGTAGAAKEGAVVVSAVGIALAPHAPAVHRDIYDMFRGWAKIVAEDGTYLGTLDDNYASDSIYNEYSDHGSTYSDESLWNEYSDHGNDYSDESAFNEYASNPPVLLKDGEVIGRLTVKDYEYDAVNARTVGKDCDWKD